ncbi:hypothetical protein Hanom_Chr08g00745811 [Helianthus anomalus]
MTCKGGADFHFVPPFIFNGKLMRYGVSVSPIRHTKPNRFFSLSEIPCSTVFGFP